MEQGITETRAELVTRRRRRSALLSAVAALLTAVFFCPKGVTEGLPFTRLWLEMSIPTVALSVCRGHPVPVEGALRRGGGGRGAVLGLRAARSALLRHRLRHPGCPPDVGLVHQPARTSALA